MKYPRPGDELVAMLLRSLPEVPDAVLEAPPFARADVHGVGGVLHDALVAARPAPALRTQLASRTSRTVASELDYAAHLAMLARIDGALAVAGCRGVLLKGALLARRLYPRPSARATTDIDLLVEPATLAVAEEAVRAIGYEPLEGPREAWFREHHHHLHFLHPHALPLELHFHAYRGFGATLESRALLERSEPAQGFRMLSVLAPEDELVYLAVHAAAHRFARLGWLYDCKLLLATMSDPQIAEAGVRARMSGYARPLAFAARLLVDVLGAPAARLRPVMALGALRGALLARVVGEPDAAVLRSATRFVYTASLAATSGGAARYAARSSLAYARRVLGRGE